MSSHPDQEQLLRYADGESPARVAGSIRKHLEACWQCRAELESLQKTVGECVRYRKNVLERHLPPPPAPWSDIYRGFAQIDAELDKTSLRERIARILQAPLRSSARWVPVAAAVAIACLIFYRFRQAPSVQAAELLRKAIAAADARPVKAHRIEIRTEHGRVAALSSVQPLLQTAHYDWNDPLSARSYQAWRDQLSDKQDEVVEEPGAYRIRTSTTSGALTIATLKIDARDLRPVEERFEFRNREWVEISELAEDAAPENLIASQSKTPERTGAEVPGIAPNGIAPDATHLPAAASSATIGDELHVLASLHKVGADLGDPIEVSRVGGGILVAGIGIAPQRQQEIQDVLSSQNHVMLRFSESAPAKVEPGREVPSVNAASPELQKLQDRVAEQIGGRAYFTQLAAQVLDLSEPMMARVYALRRLAEQIPVDAEPELSAQDRQLLRSLRQEHTESLRSQAAQIDRLLRPVLEPVSGAPRPEPDGTTFPVGWQPAWQPATEQLFQTARRVEKQLAVLFGAAAGEAASDRLPAQLLSSLAQLRTSLDAMDRSNK